MDAPATTPLAIPVMEMTGVTVGSRGDGGAAVLEDVNWRVEAAEYWVLGGMHGSGKSDLLAMSAGLIPPLGGSYRLFGRPMPASGDQFLAERMRIGLVFDGGQLFHHLTIEENIALPLRYHPAQAGGDLGLRVNSILEATGLSSQAGLYPGQAGRGWQKRAGLARALALRPEVLLLDNPLGGLDSRQLHWWLDMLDQLSRGHAVLGGQAVTLVVAADDMRPWRDRPGSFAILQKRQFHALGHHPQLAGVEHPLVRELLAEQPASAR
jgi:ABC-type transporter Mla maintaining outer membrane lipid asymmetry ATPase subunit MlaF